MPTEVVSVGVTVHTLTRGLTRQSYRTQFSSTSQEDLLETCLAAAEVTPDTPSHQDIFRSALHSPLVGFLGRRHRDFIHSGTDDGIQKWQGALCTAGSGLTTDGITSVITSTVFVLLMLTTLFSFSQTWTDVSILRRPLLQLNTQ